MQFQFKRLKRQARRNPPTLDSSKTRRRLKRKNLQKRKTQKHLRRSRKKS
jgi:hypothetical protein